MNRKIKSLILAGAMLLSQLSAIPVQASGVGESVGANGNFTDNTASSEVYVVASSAITGNLTLTVPTTVTLAVDSDGTIIAPTNYKITNNGVIPAHVSAITTNLKNGFAFGASGDKTLNLTLNTNPLTTGNVSIVTANAWNIPVSGELALDFAGSVGNIANFVSSTDVFTISYTITAGAL